MRPFEEAVVKCRQEMAERRSSVLIRSKPQKGNEVHHEAALQMIEDGEAHAIRAQGSGRAVWWAHCWPGETAPEFSHTSRRNEEDL